MYDNTMELAENKLLLLYILNKIKFPISKNQLTEIILENNFINYFTLQHYLTELNAAAFVQHSEKEGKHRILITEKGIKVLTLFENRLPEDKLQIINSYLKNKLHKIKNELAVTADYTIESSSSYIVNLKAVEDDSILIDLKLNVPSNKQAIHICNNWKEHSSQIYNDIIKLLYKD
jgi:predicted transcriptional regulator